MNRIRYAIKSNKNKKYAAKIIRIVVILSILILIGFCTDKDIYCRKMKQRCNSE